MTDCQAGRLKLVRALATGSGSEILEMQGDGGERFALKLGLELDERGVRRHEREVQALGAVAHANVVRMVGHGERRGGVAWVLMPLLVGTTLADRLRGGRPLTVRRARRLFFEYLAGLGAIHEAGLVHRDVAPSNLFIGREANEPPARRRGIVIDLGYAKGPLAGATLETTSTHPCSGPWYFAPEQLVASRVDARTDVFALGLCLFEALAGFPAYAGQDPFAVVDRPPPHLEDVLPGRGLEPIGDVVAAATHPDPASRYQDAASFAGALEDVARRYEEEAS